MRVPEITGNWKWTTKLTVHDISGLMCTIARAFAPRPRDSFPVPLSQDGDVPEGGSGVGVVMAAPRAPVPRAAMRAGPASVPRRPGGRSRALGLRPAACAGRFAL